MTFVVEWPDGSKQSCYSPSLVMHDYLSAGARYSVADFVGRSRVALTAASERVKAKFGVYCTSASAQLDEIERVAERYSSTSTVRVLSMSPATVTGAPR